MLLDVLKHFWWAILFRGVVAVLFGIVVLLRPDVSLVVLVLMFGAFALVDGIATGITAIGGRKENDRWWLMLLGGLAGIAVGILTFRNPAVTALVLLYYIAFWVIVTGVVECMAAIRLRREIDGEVWLAVAGVVSVLFGVLLLVRPAIGMLSVLWMLGIYSIVIGVVHIALAFKVRQLGRRIGGLTV